METVRIGCVQYLNTLPLIEGVRSWRGCAVVTAVPSRLIGMLTSHEVDVALASVIDAARATTVGGAVTLLPAGMIGCDGATLTVRVYSTTPIGDLGRVYADTDSHTSAALLRVLMKRRFRRDIELVDFDARERWGRGGGEGWPPAVLLIGDKVMTDGPPAGVYAHEWDLGQAWKELTGLPFVYAAWMCRAGEESSTKVRAAAAVLDRARRHNATRLDWIVATRAGEKHWPRERAAEYVGERLRYGVGEAEREAVEKFLRWSAELGLCERVEPAWADLAGAV
jgi:chorismate dehydratase